MGYWSLSAENRARARASVSSSKPTSVGVIDRGGLEWAVFSISLMLIVFSVVVGCAVQSIIASADSRAVVLFIASIAPLVMAIRLTARSIAFRKAIAGGREV